MGQRWKAWDYNVCKTRVSISTEKFENFKTIDQWFLVFYRPLSTKVWTDSFYENNYRRFPKQSSVSLSVFAEQRKTACFTKRYNCCFLLCKVAQRLHLALYGANRPWTYFSFRRRCTFVSYAIAAVAKIDSIAACCGFRWTQRKYTSNRVNRKVFTWEEKEEKPKRCK